MICSYVIFFKCHLLSLIASRAAACTREYLTPKWSRVEWSFLLLEYSFNSISGVKCSRSVSKSMNYCIIPRDMPRKTYLICQTWQKMRRLQTDMS